MPFYEHGDVRIHYEEAGSGFPLLLIPGGGLNSTIGLVVHRRLFNAMEEFKDDFRCITMDLRNAITGESTGPLEMTALGRLRRRSARPDGAPRHAEVPRAGLLHRGPVHHEAHAARARARRRRRAGQPSGHRPEIPDIFWNNNTTNWGPALCAKRPDITMPMVERFLHNIYRSPADFVFSVTRDFVRCCQTPMLVMPDDVPPHPFAISMEILNLAPNAEVSIYPWKEPKDTIRKVVEPCGPSSSRTSRPPGAEPAAGHFAPSRGWARRRGVILQWRGVTGRPVAPRSRVTGRVASGRTS